jgi:hypothetical protein
MKSSSSAGPAQSSLQGILVVGDVHALVRRDGPRAAIRAHPVERPIVELNPVVGAPEPVLGEGLVSVSVLPVTATSSGSSGLPAGGLRALSPNSAALIGLVGIASARAAAPAALRAVSIRQVDARSLAGRAAHRRA